MTLITGITGAAAEPSAVPEALPAQMELPLEPEVCAAEEDPELAASLGSLPPDAESEPIEKEPGPGLEERSYTLVGRALRFVMQKLTPSAWQTVVQHMAEQMPTKIELQAIADLEWKDEKHHQELLEELHDQGFVEAGTYFAEAMKSNLHLLINEAYDLRAVIYENENSGVVLDLVTLYGDGTGITYVNREDPGYEQSPLHPNVYMGHIPVYELLDECLRERPKKAMLPQGVASAARFTELEYEFGAKRLRGEPVNPVEMADAYLEVIEQANLVTSDEAESESMTTLAPLHASTELKAKTAASGSD